MTADHTAPHTLARQGGCATVAAVDRCSYGWRLIAALSVVTLLGTPVAAQEAPGEPAEREDAATAADPAPPALPAPAEQRRDYWPLLVAGIGVTAGGLAGARLARMEAERWEGMPTGTSERQRQIDGWNTWSVAGSVAATVGIGLIVLWGTIRLSQGAGEPARP